jgi:methionyl aminopeptidase
MVNLGKKEVKGHSDGWTIYAKDKKPSAHYEHTIAVRSKGPADILSNHTMIEEAADANPAVREVAILDMVV